MRSWKATVSHFEIPARDVERAARFYREVFGWRVEPVAWEGGPYFKIREAGEAGGKGIGGGLMPADGAEGGVDQPLLVLHVEEALEDWLERIVAAGGSVDHPPSRVGEMGSFARFRDPEGNRLGLWQRA